MTEIKDYFGHILFPSEIQIAKGYENIALNPNSVCQNIVDYCDKNKIVLTGRWLATSKAKIDDNLPRKALSKMLESQNPYTVFFAKMLLKKYKFIICMKCEGCGRVANTTAQEPWSAWEALPLECQSVVILGVIVPIVCPRCNGAGEHSETIIENSKGQQNNMEKIRHLKINNIARIIEIEVVPENNFMIVAGENAAGKTTLIKSIVAGFGGKVPELREGQERGEINLKTDNLNIKIVRTATRDTMTATSRETGAKISKPKSVMKELLGERDFDSTEFLLATAKKQVEALLKVIKIKATKQDIVDICEDIELTGNNVVDWINGAYEQIYAERRVVNRDMKKAQHVFDQYQHVETSPIIDLEQLYVFKDLANQKELLMEKSSLKRDELSRLQDKITVLTEEYLEAQNKIEELEPYNIGEILEQIEEAKENNKNAVLAKEKALAQDSLQEKNKQVAGLTEKLVRLNSFKNEIMINTKMPIDGLDIRAGKVYLNGHPLSSASGAEQMLVAIAIAAEEIPEEGLQALFIFDPPQLDKNSWDKIEEFAKKKDIQIWISKVSNNNESGQVVLTEGRIVKK